MNGTANAENHAKTAYTALESRVKVLEKVLDGQYFEVVIKRTIKSPKQQKVQKPCGFWTL